MMQRSAPSPMTFLMDRTNSSIQQQNIYPTAATPKTPKMQHNPYGASVIPENPAEVMLHRSMTQASLDAYNAVSRASPYASGDYRGHSPLSMAGSFVEFPPVSPMYASGSFSASPYHDAAEALSMPKAQQLTKVYVGGRPVAVPSAHHSSRQTATPIAEPVQAPAVVEEAPMANEAMLTVAFRRTTGRFVLRDVRAVFGACARAAQMIGRHVIVVGDRGDDLGRVTAVEETVDGEETTSMPTIKRLASRDEITRVETTLRQDELRALEYAQQQVQRLFPNEQLTIEDATFQFDKQKLTLWYRVPDRVYFVPLLKTLNQAYRCRIWMERIEDSEINQ